MTPFSVEHELYIGTSRLSDARGRITAELDEKRAMLAEVESMASALAAEEKSLDRNFKKVGLVTGSSYFYILTEISSLEISPTHDALEPSCYFIIVAS